MATTAAALMTAPVIAQRVPALLREFLHEQPFPQFLLLHIGVAVSYSGNTSSVSGVKLQRG